MAPFTVEVEVIGDDGSTQKQKQEVMYKGSVDVVLPTERVSVKAKAQRNRPQLEPHKDTSVNIEFFYFVKGSKHKTVARTDLEKAGIVYDPDYCDGPAVTYNDHRPPNQSQQRTAVVSSGGCEYLPTVELLKSMSISGKLEDLSAAIKNNEKELRLCLVPFEHIFEGQLECVDGLLGNNLGDDEHEVEVDSKNIIQSFEKYQKLLPEGVMVIDSMMGSLLYNAALKFGGAVHDHQVKTTKVSQIPLIEHFTAPITEVNVVPCGSAHAGRMLPCELKYWHARVMAWVQLTHND